MLWISDYFDHKLSDNLSLVSYSEFVSGLAHAQGDPDLLPTTQRMSSEELASVTDRAGVSRAHLAIRALDKSMWENNFRRALLRKDIWPNLRVEYVWCTMSIDETVYAAWYLAQVMGKDASHRDFTAHAYKANHFVRP